MACAGVWHMPCQQALDLACPRVIPGHAVRVCEAQRARDATGLRTGLGHAQEVAHAECTGLVPCQQ